MLFTSAFVLPFCSSKPVSSRYIPLGVCLAIAIWISVDLPARVYAVSCLSCVRIYECHSGVVLCNTLPIQSFLQLPSQKCFY